MQSAPPSSGLVTEEVAKYSRITLLALVKKWLSGRGVSKLAARPGLALVAS